MKKKSTRSKAIKTLDNVFSRYTRLRDSKAYNFTAFKCISCGRVKPYSSADAGHFFSRTKMNTRYDEKNVHAECKYCNLMSADHLIYYQENLIKKIGQKEFDLLKIRASMTRKFSEFELKELTKYYSEKIKELEQ